MVKRIALIDTANCADVQARVRGDRGRSMKENRRFSDRILAAIRDSKIVGIRVGTQPHRSIGIWAVVAEGRVFVRSWSLKPQGWYRTFLEEPQGAVRVADREIAVRARRAHEEPALEKRCQPRLLGEVQHARIHQVRPRPRTREVQGHDYRARAVIGIS